MPIDPITEEIRAIKRELAGRFDYDLDRIVADIQQNERKSGRHFVALNQLPVVGTVIDHQNVAHIDPTNAH